MDTVFSNVGPYALSSLSLSLSPKTFSIIFSLDFSKIICRYSLLVLLPLKSQKNKMKFCKIQLKIWKDICIICRSSVSNLLLLTASQEIFTFSYSNIEIDSNYRFSNPFCLFVQIKYLIVCTRKNLRNTQRTRKEILK